MKTAIIAIAYAIAILACTAAIKANAYGTVTIQTIGSQTLINRVGQPTIVCQTIGYQTYCR